MSTVLWIILSIILIAAWARVLVEAVRVARPALRRRRESRRISAVEARRALTEKALEPVGQPYGTGSDRLAEQQRLAELEHDLLDPARLAQELDIWDLKVLRGHPAGCQGCAKLLPQVARPETEVAVATVNEARDADRIGDDGPCRWHPIRGIVPRWRTIPQYQFETCEACGWRVYL